MSIRIMSKSLMKTRVAVAEVCLHLVRAAVVSHVPNRCWRMSTRYCAYVAAWTLDSWLQPDWWLLHWHARAGSIAYVLALGSTCGNNCAGTGRVYAGPWRRSMNL